MKITLEITRTNSEEKLFDMLSDALPRLVEHFLRMQAERERRAEERARTRSSEAKAAPTGG